MFDVEVIKTTTIVSNGNDSMTVDEGDIWTIYGINNNKFLCFGENGWFWLPMKYCVPYDDDSEWY